MSTGLEDKMDSIIRSCLNNKVRRLELFGSMAQSKSISSVGDIDLLVEFEAVTPVEHADAYFNLQKELEEIFNLPVDLVERAPIRNPYLLQAIDNSKVVLYAAA